MSNRADLVELAGEANLAPSVHNTQPARWALDGDGRILLFADLSRQLKVGDPHLRDIGLSCGAALEGMVMALGARGFSAEVEDCWSAGDVAMRPGYRLVARLTLGGAQAEYPLRNWIEKRFTWRETFSPVSSETVAVLEDWATAKPDVTLATGKADIAELATRNDAVSLWVMGEKAFRRELVQWMRTSRANPNYDRDGMNLEAMHMGRFTGMAANVVLPSGLFDLLNTLGLGGALTAEAAKTKSASAIALFHRPVAESPVETGRAFYRFWLELTSHGLAGWPMAALADVEASAADLKVRFRLREGHRLVNVLRIGKAPEVMAKVRLPAGELVLEPH